MAKPRVEITGGARHENRVLVDGVDITNVVTGCRIWFENGHWKATLEVFPTKVSVTPEMTNAVQHVLETDSEPTDDTAQVA